MYASFCVDSFSQHVLPLLFVPQVQGEYDLIKCQLNYRRNPITDNI